MDYDILLIGSGIVGLATAYKLKQKKPELKLGIIEKESKSAFHQTGHNSGVIHSGIYYKTGSLKQKNCRKGLSELVHFAKEKKIPHKICGKLIVAQTQEECERLNLLYKRGQANGLKDLRLLNKKEILEYEPYVEGIQALFCQETGVIDYKKVARALEDELREKNTDFYFNCKITEIISEKNKVVLKNAEKKFRTNYFINACGLQSDRVTKLDQQNLVCENIVPFRGTYYHLKKEFSYLVKNLIYPVPNPLFPFLGVHLTRTIDNKVEMGPNASLSLSRENYSKWSCSPKDITSIFTDTSFWRFAKKHWRYSLSEYHRTFSKKAFTKSLQRLVPDIKENMLEDEFCGIRAQLLERSGDLCDDFKIKKTARGLHVLNAPSPAATASLAIGDSISSLALSSLN